MKFLYMAAAMVSLATTAQANHHVTVTHYQAIINNLGAIALGGATSTEVDMIGLANFVLTVPDGEGSPTLAYELVFQGVDFIGTDGNPDNDATAIHIHNTTGVTNSVATPHVLNIFGFPSRDDGDQAVNGPASTVTGIWDDLDLTDPTKPHAGNLAANSDTLTSQLTALASGELFLMLHTTSPNALPGTPGITIGGQILAVPEPTTGSLLLVTGMVLSRYRRK